MSCPTLAVVLPPGPEAAGTVLAVLPTSSGVTTVRASSSPLYGTYLGGFGVVTAFSGSVNDAFTNNAVYSNGNVTGLLAAGLPPHTAIAFSGTVTIRASSGAAIDNAGKGVGGVYTASYSQSISPTSVSAGLCINMRGNFSQRWKTGYGTAEFAATSAESGALCGNYVGIQAPTYDGMAKWPPSGSLSVSATWNLTPVIIATDGYNGTAGSWMLPAGAVLGVQLLNNMTGIYTATLNAATAAVTSTGTCSNAGLSWSDSSGIRRVNSYVLGPWTSRSNSSNPPVGAVGNAQSVAVSADGSALPTYTDMGHQTLNDTNWGWLCTGNNDSGAPVTIGVSARMSTTPYAGVPGAMLVSNDPGHYVTLNLKSSPTAGASPDCSRSGIALDGSTVTVLHTFAAGEKMANGANTTIPTPVLTLCNTGVPASTTGVKTLSLTINTVMQ